MGRIRGARTRPPRAAPPSAVAALAGVGTVLVRPGAVTALAGGAVDAYAIAPRTIARLA